MSRTDSAGEPSMEELLVKVRQIIADEPGRSTAVFPAIEPNPLVPQSFAAGDATAKPASGETPPAQDRLSGVLKAGSLPATSPFGSKRPMSFDQDLADMLDEGGDGDAPKPATRATDFSVLSQKPEGPAPAASPTVADASLPPQFAAPAAAAAVPPPFGTPAVSADAPAPPPPRSFGFPPLKKPGFYPPQAAVTPTLPPLPPQAAAPAEAEKKGSDAGGLDEALKRLTNLGAVVPGEPPLARDAPAGPSFGAPLSPPPAAAPSLTVPPTKPDVPLAAAAAVSTAAAAQPTAPAVNPKPAAASAPIVPAAAAGPAPAAQPEKSNAAPVVPPPAAAPKVTVAAPASPLAAKPADMPSAEAKPRQEPLAAPKPAAMNGAKPFEAAAGDPSVVAAQALDALAQGLAASAATTAIPLTPVAEAAPAPMASAAGRVLPPPAAAASQRTLEDVVADMLRPMLERWVSDNMPRIMERALRAELAKSMPTGQKPPGA